MFGELSGAMDALRLIINSNIGANTKPEATFFVSKDGNDTWSGKMAEPNAEKTDGPFASLARARDAIREMKAKQSITEPVTVLVRGGAYYLDDTLVFEQQDSGTKECPVTYMAYPGEKPVISGGRKITGPWKAYKGEIMVCSLKL